MIRAILIAVMSALLAAGCEAKPSEEDCEKAIENVRRISGLSRADVGADPKAAIRSCQANSSRATVQCMIEAKTMEDIVACEGKEGKKYESEAQQRAKEAENADLAEPAAGDQPEADQAAEPAADEPAEADEAAQPAAGDPAKASE